MWSYLRGFSDGRDGVACSVLEAQKPVKHALSSYLLLFNLNIIAFLIFLPFLYFLMILYSKGGSRLIKYNLHPVKLNTFLVCSSAGTFFFLDGGFGDTTSLAILFLFTDY